MFRPWTPKRAVCIGSVLKLEITKRTRKRASKSKKVLSLRRFENPANRYPITIDPKSTKRTNFGKISWSKDFVQTARVTRDAPINAK
jgi:hypothetical protein